MVSKFAVTVTAWAGMAKVVVVLLALARVTPPAFTVQPVNLWPLGTVAVMVTVSSST